MKLATVVLFSMVSLGSAVFADTGPTYHICDGIHAHKESDGYWHLTDGHTEWKVSGMTSVNGLLMKHCKGMTHPGIHTSRKDCPSAYHKGGKSFYNYSKHVPFCDYPKRVYAYKKW